MESAADYPYISTGGNCGSCTCTYNSNKGLVATTAVNGKPFVYSATDVSSIQAAVATKPNSAAVYADASAFQTYTSGVLAQSQCTDYSVDHAIAIVGYGTDSSTGMDYFLVQNSWGTSWGNQGFIQLEATTSPGTCGIN